MTKPLTATEFAARCGATKKTVCTWCAAAEQAGETWCWREGRRWQIDESKALKALRKKPVKKRGGGKALKRLRNHDPGGQASKAKRTKAPSDTRKKQQGQSESKPKDSNKGATTDHQRSDQSDDDDSELHAIEQQIQTASAIASSLTTLLKEQNNNTDLIKAFNEISRELRMLWERKRTVLEADKHTITRDLADQRLMALAKTVRQELDNLPKSAPSALIQSLADGGVDIADVDHATKLMMLGLEEEAKKVLTRMADEIDEAIEEFKQQ